MFKNSLGVITCNGADCNHTTDCSFYKEGAEKSAMGSAVCSHYMTRFDYVISMSMQELAEWLLELFDGQAETPWNNWLSEKFCENCPAVERTEYVEAFDREMTNLYAPCEFGGENCPHGVVDLNELTVIKLWLTNFVEVTE